METGERRGRVGFRKGRAVALGGVLLLGVACGNDASLNDINDLQCNDKTLEAKFSDEVRAITFTLRQEGVHNLKLRVRENGDDDYSYELIQEEPGTLDDVKVHSPGVTNGREKPDFTFSHGTDADWSVDVNPDEHTVAVAGKCGNQNEPIFD